VAPARRRASGDCRRRAHVQGHLHERARRAVHDGTDELHGQGRR
jgi:hypothetical protein